MRCRFALLALAALAGTPASAAAQESAPACREAVISFEVTPRSPAGFVKYHEMTLDASGSYRPGSPHSPIVGFYADWLPSQAYGGYKHMILQLMETGWHRVGVEHANCDGSYTITWRTIHVADIAPWTDIPWAYRRYGDPRPTFIRGRAFVDDQQRIARVIRRGVALRVECPRECIVDSALQITRYRARRLRLATHGSRTNLALASHTAAALEHRLLLRPDRAARGVLRRQRHVPARVLVVVRSLKGAKHTIRAKVELRRR